MKERDFLTGRAAVLKGFMNGGKLYYSSLLPASALAKASANMASEVAWLEYSAVHVLRAD